MTSVNLLKLIIVVFHQRLDIFKIRIRGAGGVTCDVRLKKKTLRVKYRSLTSRNLQLEIKTFDCHWKNGLLNSGLLSLLNIGLTYI